MYEFSVNYAINKREDIGGYMFEIEEFRFITRVISKEFYLSPKTTFEYLLYRDVEHFEVVVSFDIYAWILETRQIYLMAYQEKDYGYEVTFIDQHLSFTMFYKRPNDMIDLGLLNIDGVMAEIKLNEGRGISTCEINKKWYQMDYYDPYNHLESIKRNYIAPLKNIENMSQVFKMFSRMAELNFDLLPQVSNELGQYQLKADYHYSIREDLFKILSNTDSYKYIHLLSKHHFFDQVLEVVKKMDRQKWDEDIKALKKLEVLLTTEDYFNDSIKKIIERNLLYRFPCSLTKYQMLKFSVLFHHAYKSMKLKHNAPELYESDFTDFCEIFGFVNESCKYYGHVIQNSRNNDSKYKDEKIDLGHLYDFFENIHKNVIDILLVEFIENVIQDPVREVFYKERFEYFVKAYTNKYLEIQSINSEITTLEFDSHHISDAEMMLLIDEVKKQVFLGDLRYDRQSIVRFMRKKIFR